MLAAQLLMQGGQVIVGQVNQRGGHAPNSVPSPVQDNTRPSSPAAVRLEGSWRLAMLGRVRSCSRSSAARAPR